MRVFHGFFIGLFIASCAMAPNPSKKINGVSFVASGEALAEEHINPVVNINANYVAIMPFGFIRDLNHPEIAFNTERQWYGETKRGAKQNIESLKKKHIKIMLKPQIWVWRGEFTGNIKMTNEDDWKLLEDSYTKFIKLYAQLAQETKTEILCIGTELEKFIESRPGYWNNLIIEIKKIYKGRLTYAANWDEYKRTPFWSELDYIGVDAYFPVSEEKTPNVDDCKQGWNIHKTIIKSISKKHNKPILFTEFGYRSIDYTGKEPWKSGRSELNVNLEAQANATQALFDVFWKEDWFAGGFLWKWHHNHEKSGGENNKRFTPQNKPVENIIKDIYMRY